MNLDTVVTYKIIRKKQNKSIVSSHVENIYNRKMAYSKKMWYFSVRQRYCFKGTRARFSNEAPGIIGPVKMFCFPFEMGVSIVLKIIQ